MSPPVRRGRAARRLPHSADAPTSRRQEADCNPGLRGCAPDGKRGSPRLRARQHGAGRATSNESEGGAVDVGAARGIEGRAAAPPTVALCGCAPTVSGVSGLTLIRLTVDSAMRARMFSLYGRPFRGGPAMGATSDRVGLRLPLAAGARSPCWRFWRGPPAACPASPPLSKRGADRRRRRTRRVTRIAVAIVDHIVHLRPDEDGRVQGGCQYRGGQGRMRCSVLYGLTY